MACKTGPTCQMTLPHKRLPVSAATLAALIIVVQAFLGGSWMGAQAAAGPRDAFGNIMCSADMGGSSQGGPHSDGYDCGCCLAGCDTGTAIVPEASRVEPVSVAFVLMSGTRRLVDMPIWRHEWQPFGPRGPPA